MNETRLQCITRSQPHLVLDEIAPLFPAAWHGIAYRYAGTDVAVMTAWQEGGDPAAAFASAYEREFGFVLDRPVFVDDVRVRATGRTADLPELKV